MKSHKDAICCETKADKAKNSETFWTCQHFKKKMKTENSADHCLKWSNSEELSV